MIFYKKLKATFMIDYAISNENWRLLNNSSIKMLQLAV